MPMKLTRKVVISGTVSLLVVIVAFAMYLFTFKHIHTGELKAQYDIKFIADVINTHFIETGYLLTEDQGLELLATPEVNLVARNVDDPWGYPYSYEKISDYAFSLKSIGSIIEGEVAVVIYFKVSKNGVIKLDVLPNNSI